jgi:hypothetical protein
MKKFSQFVLLAATAGFVASPVSAVQKVAEEPGVSGFFLLGVGALSVESNTLATTFGGNIDVGDDTIGDLDDDADSESSLMPLANLSITYTFENKATELFFGNSLEDFLQFDYSTTIGVRHQTDKLGIFEVASLSTPLATEVWEDPYLTGDSRDETDRTSDGFRLQWGNIAGSNFDVRVSTREIDIDKERSGDSLVGVPGGITASEQELLDRNGDVNVASIIYNWRIDEGRFLVVTGNSIDYDLDGDAMSNDGFSMKLTYGTRLDPRKRLVTNFEVGSYDYDKRNPVFNEKDSKDVTGLTMTLFLEDPFGAKGWIGNVGLVYAQSDNDIDFYDTTATMISFGMLRRF